MKILKTKKKHAHTVYFRLKNIRPALFQNIEEMKVLQESILPPLKGSVSEFLSSEEKIDEVRRKFNLKEIDEVKLRDEIVSINKGIEAVALERGDEIVEIRFENDGFNKLLDFFTRWAKDQGEGEQQKGWFQNIDDYLALWADINEGNKKVVEGT
jgi:hypothetical protein